MWSKRSLDFIRVKGGAVPLDLPSTSEVRSVTVAAFLLPAGKLRPILSSLSRKDRPPFFDLALQDNISSSAYEHLAIKFSIRSFSRNAALSSFVDFLGEEKEVEEEEVSLRLRRRQLPP